MNCEICGKEAEITLSPDIDTGGFQVCADHIKLMKELYLIMLFLGEDEYNESLKRAQIMNTKSTKKRKKFVK